MVYWECHSDEMANTLKVVTQARGVHLSDDINCILYKRMIKGIMNVEIHNMMFVWYMLFLVGPFMVGGC